MKYQFPEINNIDEVLAAIEGRDEFRCYYKEDGSAVINYMVNYENTFPPIVDCDNSMSGSEWNACSHQQKIAKLLRECRGIAFDIDGTVAARKMHKFFNVGEKEETRLENIYFSQPHVILEKLDGSMVVAQMIDGMLQWATKAGITDTSKQAEEYVKDHPEYIRFAEFCIEAGQTPTFEWCSRQQRIVIDYPEDQLVLLAVRLNRTGIYWSHKELEDWAKTFGILVVRKIYDSNQFLPEQLIEEIRKQEDIEGVVIRFDDGHMVKIKAAQYLRIHRAKDRIKTERHIVALILNNELDDLKGVLNKEDLDHVVEYENEFQKRMFSLKLQLFNIWLDWNTKSRKEFALGCDMPDLVKAVIFKLFDRYDENAEYDSVKWAIGDLVNKHIIDSCNNNRKFEETKSQWFSGLVYRPVYTGD